MLTVTAFRFFALPLRLRLRMPFAATVTIQFTTAVPPLRTSALSSPRRMASAVSEASSPELSRDRYSPWMAERDTSRATAMRCVSRQAIATISSAILDGTPHCRTSTASATSQDSE